MIAPLSLREDLAALPPVAWVLLGAWVLLHVGLAIAALVALHRTPTERLSAPRVVWVLAALLVQVFGPLAFFLVGRKPEAAQDPAHLDDGQDAARGPRDEAQDAARGARDVVDELYGTGAT